MTAVVCLLGPLLVGMWLAPGWGVGAVLPAGSLVLYLLVVLYLVHHPRERNPHEVSAPHDPLTGLPDRVLFQDRVEVALAHATRSGASSAVMLLDLDRFKDVNDSLGHDTGDELLQAVARRLRSCLRQEDTVARLGADEFAILLSSVAGPGDAVTVAQKVLAAFETSFAVAGRQIGTSGSVGIALSPRDGSDVTTLIRHADTAMSRAKATGRNSFQLFTPDLSARARLKFSLESNLHAALDRDEFAVHYQPQLDVPSGRIVGVEALARWRHPRLGYVPPGTFIPLAERSGFILPLGEWVLETACRQAQQWHEEGLLTATLSVNVSAEQFARQRFDQVVARVLERTGLPGERLELELTESVLVHDPDAVRATLHALHELGVGCALDDFGTGFSALSYLARMPIDRLKIDRCFIQPVRPRDRLILEAIIALARSLQVHITAEGVETEEQARFLLARGCRQMQGYLFGRPMPAEELRKWLRARAAAKDRTHPANATFLRTSVAPKPRTPPVIRSGARVVCMAPDPSGLAACPKGSSDPAAVATLLDAVCRDSEGPLLDPQLLASVVEALEANEGRPRDQRSHPQSLPARLSAVTA